MVHSFHEVTLNVLGHVRRRSALLNIVVRGRLLLARNEGQLAYPNRLIHILHRFVDRYRIILNEILYLLQLLLVWLQREV